MNDLRFRETEWVFEVIDYLGGQAVELSRAAIKRLNRKPRPYGCTLKPGLDTPTWNALVEAVRPHLNKRGEKAQLARILLVHRGRVHDYFVRRTAMPDAERTLLLLQWLALRQAGRSPG